MSYCLKSFRKPFSVFKVQNSEIREGELNTFISTYTSLLIIKAPKKPQSSQFGVSVFNCHTVSIYIWQ